MPDEWFVKSFGPTGRFMETWGELVRLLPDQLSELASWVAGNSGGWRYGTPSPPDDRELARAVGVPVDTAHEMLSMLQYLSHHATSRGYAPEEVVRQLREADILRDDAPPYIARSLTDAFAGLAAAAEAYLDYACTQAGLPVFQGIETCADLRLRARRRFDPEVDSADTYSPELRSLVPVGICKIHTDDDHDDAERQLSFQVTPREVGRIIAAFTALREELALLAGVAARQEDESGGGQ